MSFKDDFLVRLIVALLPPQVKPKRSKPMFRSAKERQAFFDIEEEETCAYQMRRVKRTGFATKEAEDDYYDDMGRRLDPAPR